MNYLKKTILFLLLSVPAIGNAQPDTVSIVSWNVFLRPAILSDNQMGRVDSIAHYILETEHDVVVLQEVFHKRARKKLVKSLQTLYPYRTVRGKRSFWGVPCGVLILSKYKLRKETNFSFKKGKGSDGLAHKGAIVVDIDSLNLTVVGTHLQAGHGEEREGVRLRQLKTMKGEVAKLTDSSTHVLFTGDFNIDRFETDYDSLLTILDVENHELRGNLKKTANFTDHDLFNSSGFPIWIDFILTNKAFKHLVLDSRIDEPRALIGEKRSRLSDHNPIITTFILSN
jgi:exonuclease III